MKDENTLGNQGDDKKKAAPARIEKKADPIKKAAKSEQPKPDKSKITIANTSVPAPETSPEVARIKKTATKISPVKKATIEPVEGIEDKAKKAVSRSRKVVEKPIELTGSEPVEAIALTNPTIIADMTVSQNEASQPSSVEEEATVINSCEVTFRIKYHTRLGERLFVVGNHALLGNNNEDHALPLEYLDNEHWQATVTLVTQGAPGKIAYYYFSKNEAGQVTPEWQGDKQLDLSFPSSTGVLLIDSWNPSSAIENTFFTEPFKEVLLKGDLRPRIGRDESRDYTHQFRVKSPLLAKGQTLSICGSAPEIGAWDTSKAVPLTLDEDRTWYTVNLSLNSSSFPFVYKYAIYDLEGNSVVQFENGSNRIFNDSLSLEKRTIVSDGFANLPFHHYKAAGVAIPVFSLRSASGLGVGEFNDLKLLVDWAKKIGLKVVQILPVNDTTATHTQDDSYPYAAISAFALHPLYLNLPTVINPENSSVLTGYSSKQEELNALAAVDYIEVMKLKWELIKQIFPLQKAETFNNVNFQSFFAENSHWLVPYAAFSYLREKYKTSAFNTWPTNSVFDPEEISALASSPADALDEISMYYFVQYHLHLQLRAANDYAHQNGIIVKGDIPIGIYRNSCDAWQAPNLFFMNMQAGAPPDGFAIKGQNWGFPTYNWHKMREDDFSWWKKRFTQMSYYFDAFRIDHILGFFRIWSIPMESVEGIMGHFVPAIPIYINEFYERGIMFDFNRLCTPFINDLVLWEVFGANNELVRQSFLEHSGDGNYRLKEEFNTQRKVENYFAEKEKTELNHALKYGLFDLISNVILFEEEGSSQQRFHFRIAAESTLSFRYLDGYLQHHLRELYNNYFYRRQDDYWAMEALLKLPALKRSTNMLVCGEDLGMVPACVPHVMRELAILSLEIQRMPKDPKREFFHPNDAPFLSVVTPSTHDMSTIRGWWEEDRGATQRFFNNELGQWGTAPYFCEPWICKIILMQHLYSPAMLSIFQLQDLFSISAAIRRENPHDERINIPADPKHYWRYRMHLTLESLLEDSEFNTELHKLVADSGR